jgi:hypothetical protein
VSLDERFAAWIDTSAYLAFVTSDGAASVFVQNRRPRSFEVHAILVLGRRQHATVQCAYQVVARRRVKGAQLELVKRKPQHDGRITMANSKKLWQGLVAVVIVLAVMLNPVMMASAQDNGLRQDGQGRYAQLTAQWWQWILEQPVTGNPNLDQTGADAANGQPGKGVFLLAGTLGGAATRYITVPANTALFFALLNNVGLAPQPAPQPKPGENQVPQLRTLYAAPLIDGINELHVSLDGVSLLDFVNRVKSPVFHFASPENGLLGLGNFTAVSDGYWLHLAPLPPGTYVLTFGGTSDAFTVDITDYITVQ